MRNATKAVVLYLVLGGVWIVSSDRLFAGEGSHFAQTAKGLGFVAVSGVVFYLLLLWWERKAAGAERALAETASAFKTAFERLDDVLFIVGPDRKIIECSESVQSVLGYAPSELIGKTTEILHVNREAFEEFARRGEPALAERGVFRTEFTMRHRDGHEVLTENTVGVIRGGELLLSIVRDVTSERKAEREIAGQRAHLEALLANVTDIVAIVGRDGTIEYLSPAVERILGYSRDEIAGLSYDGLVHPDDLLRVAETLEQAASEPGLVTRVTCRFLHKDGSWVMAESTGARPIGGEIDGVVVSTRDVSAERELSDKEQQLVQAQKMEAVGRLAGGIAHDFNNILTVILAYSSFIGEEIDEDDPRVEDLAALQEASGQAIDLTKQLLLFSRQQSSAPEVVDLDEVVGKLHKMLGRVLGEDIALDIKSGDDLPRIYIDGGRLGQVLMNLAINARDAMPTGGKLSVETTSLDVPADQAANHGAEPGRFACIEVTDSGVGMDAATMKQIFDPFFTTKPAGRGTGLGLSTSYGIVNQAGGWIEVDSKPGEGTTFSVYLPETTAEQAATEPPTTAELVESGSGETILLVEDDPAVRSAVRRQLESAGYHVVQVGEPTDAIAAAQREKIDLLVTDVVMHGLNGPALSEELFESGLCNRVLFISGYTPEELGGRQIPDLSKNLLPKPFSRAQLLERVQQALQTSS